MADIFLGTSVVAPVLAVLSSLFYVIPTKYS